MAKIVGEARFAGQLGECYKNFRIESVYSILMLPMARLGVSYGDVRN